MRVFTVKVTSANPPDGPYTIYEGTITFPGPTGTIMQKQDVSGNAPATNLTKTEMINGVSVFTPNTNITQITVYNVTCGTQDLLTIPSPTPTRTPYRVTPTPTKTPTPTITPTPTSTPSSLTEIIIDTYTPDSMQYFTVYSFAAQTSNSTNIDTNLNVQITWTGDQGGVVTETVQIPSGNFCNSLSFNSGGRISSLGESLTSITVSLSPTSSGTQSYTVGTNSTGPQPC